MKVITKVGTTVAAGAFTLALAAGTPAAAAASTATISAAAGATISATTAAPAAAQAAAFTGPRPSVRWLCGKRIIKKLIPACSHGRWELVTIKKMRCLQGHAPYVGITGPAKLAYWANRCFKQGEWEKW
ncbi:MAG TPA: hypothetical protein VFV66_32445 [Nonomuraea sp.]|nr:hypothetical protein [Nonomuraea sp.]